MMDTTTKRVQNIRLEPLNRTQSLKSTFFQTHSDDSTTLIDATSEVRIKHAFDSVVWVRSNFPQQQHDMLDSKLPIRILTRDFTIRSHQTPDLTKTASSTQARLRMSRELTKSNTICSSDSTIQEQAPSSLNEINSLLSISPLIKEAKKPLQPMAKTLYDSNTASGSDAATPTTQCSDNSRIPSKGASFSQYISTTPSAAKVMIHLKEGGRKTFTKNFFQMNSNKTNDELDCQKAFEREPTPIFGHKLSSSNKENIVPNCLPNNVVPSNKSSICEDAASSDIIVKDNIERVSCATRKPVPKVTAKSWALYDGETRMYIAGRNSDEIREIASLTKIMTCLVCLRVAKKLKISLDTCMVRVSSTAASMIGTSANLKCGDTLTAWDMLHGLMLPSGNDAAFALAEHFGRILFFQSDEYKDRMRAQENFKSAFKEEITCKTPVKYFIREMNRYARDIGLSDTIFANPHGLMHKYNRSTARDIGVLSCEAMASEAVRTIVRTKEHSCTITISSKGENKTRTATWENTNKLLWKGFDGLKTGITFTAGPCLTSALNKEGKLLICVVLGCKSMEHRFTDSVKLATYGMDRLLNAKK